jgi:transposase-like protein
MLREAHACTAKGVATKWANRPTFYQVWFEESAEVNKMGTLKCPSCGSSNLSLLGPDDYKCLSCGTSFRLTHAQTGFVDVVLVQAGRKPIDVVLALREATTSETSLQMLDLATAKRLTDSPPCVVVPNVLAEVGERIKARLEKAGATVE